MLSTRVPPVTFAVVPESRATQKLRARTGPTIRHGSRFLTGRMFRSVSLGAMFTRHAISTVGVVDARLFRKSLSNLIPRIERLLEGEVRFDGLLDLVKGQRSPQRNALDVFHHKVVRPDIMQGTNVGMVQGGNRVRFALEALGELLVGNLDGNDAI